MRVATRSPPKKLQSREVSEIRKLYQDKRLSQQKLARKYGVSQAKIWSIVNDPKERREG